MLRTLALLAALGLSTPALAKPLFPWTPKTTRLKNGLTVVRLPFKSPGMVAYYSVVRVGSRNEVEPGHTGFAHFFEHVMFKGTKAWPIGTRDALLGKLGFAENAWTSDDLTVYHVTGPSSALPQLVEVEADRFQHLEYSEETFQTEARAVLGEYHKSASNPGLKLAEALRATAFKAHPYRHTTLGFYEDIQAMPTRYAYSKEFFKRWYTPDNVVLVVVGDFDDAALLALVGKHYGGWSGTTAKVEIPKEAPQTGLRTATVDWKTPTLPRHGHYWRTPAAGAAVKNGALQQVLGGYLAGPVSPLYKSLVLEQQLVESLGESTSQRRDGHLFGIQATLKDEAHRPAVDSALAQAVAELVQGKVDEARVKAVKDNLFYGLLMGLETPDAVATTLALAVGTWGTPDAVERLQQAIRAVTGRDLVAFAKAHLREQNRTALVLTAPEKGGGR